MPDAPISSQRTRYAPCSRPRRQLARLTLLLIHLAVGFAALAADARAEQGPGFSHFEAGTDDCTGGHDHVNCQFCRLLGSSPDPAPRCDAPHEWALPVVAPPPADDRPANPVSGPFAGPRAPPLD